MTAISTFPLNHDRISYTISWDTVLSSVSNSLDKILKRDVYLFVGTPLRRTLEPKILIKWPNFLCDETSITKHVFNDSWHLAFCRKFVSASFEIFCDIRWTSIDKENFKIPSKSKDSFSRAINGFQKSDRKTRIFWIDWFRRVHLLFGRKNLEKSFGGRYKLIPFQIAFPLKTCKELFCLVYLVLPTKKYYKNLLSNAFFSKIVCYC